MPTKTIFLSSAAASVVDLTTASAKWYLNEPLRFTVTRDGADRPVDWGGAKTVQLYPEVGVHDFSFINFFINISSTLGNNTFTYTDGLVTYTCTFPDGNWDIASYNAYLKQHQIDNTGGFVRFQILPNYVLSKAYLQFEAAPHGVGYQAVFAVNSTLTGFTAGSYPAALSLGSETIVATNTARFNLIESVNVTTNLSNNCIASFGGLGQQSNILLSVIPTAGIGYSQYVEPSNIIYVPSEVLTGSVSEIQVQLKDQLGRSINMTENFHVTLSIRY